MSLTFEEFLSFSVKNERINTSRSIISVFMHCISMQSSKNLEVQEFRTLLPAHMMNIIEFHCKIVYKCF